MHAHFLGKDPESDLGNSPTLYATDRTDRRTYLAQGWAVTDPQALADVGPVPAGELLVELPEEVLEFYLATGPGRSADLAHRGRVRPALRDL